MSALKYLREQLGSDFLSEWKRLSDSDKDDLKRWALEEMAVLGI